MDEFDYLSDSELEALDFAVRLAEEESANNKRKKRDEQGDEAIADIEDLVDRPRGERGDVRADQHGPLAQQAPPNLIRRNGVLWVTDICAAQWCDLQVQYQVREKLR
jgi:hypothetical protein